jgi:hypothetical protein
MAPFLYRCPNTGDNVQGWAADDPEDDDLTYIQVTRLACAQARRAGVSARAAWQGPGHEARLLRRDYKPGDHPRRRQARRHRFEDAAEAATVAAAGRSGEAEQLCTQCGAVRVAGEPCFHCGFLPAPPRRSVDFNDGDLGLVDRSRHANGAVYTAEERARWHAMLVAIGIECGYKAGWAAYKHKEKFGAFPPWGSSPQPIQPSPEVRSWVRSRLIAYAKRRGAA